MLLVIFCHSLTSRCGVTRPPCVCVGFLQISSASSHPPQTTVRLNGDLQVAHRCEQFSVSVCWGSDWLDAWTWCPFAFCPVTHWIDSSKDEEWRARLKWGSALACCFPSRSALILVQRLQQLGLSLVGQNVLQSNRNNNNAVHFSFRWRHFSRFYQMVLINLL